MSTVDRDVAPQITLESLREKNEIPYVGFNTRNTVFIVGSTAGGYLGGQMFIGNRIISFTLAFIAFYLSYDLVRSTPPYCDITQWAKINLRYLRKASQYNNTAEAHVDSDSMIRAVVERPETTRNLTKVKRFYPPHGIIERDNGSYAMLLRYEPPNMDFKSNSEYTELMMTLAQTYNDVIDFDVTLHATTRPVDMEAYFDQLASRMDDPDVNNNEIFKALLTEMKESRREMLYQSDTEIVHFYFIISVDELEIKDVEGGDDAASDRSRFFQLLDRGEDEETKMAKERRIKKKLDSRARVIASLISGGSQVTQDASIQRVPCTEAAAILESYWTGKKTPLRSETTNHGPIPHTVTQRGPKENEVNVKPISEVATDG